MDIQERVLNAFQQEHREQIEAIRSLLSDWPAIAPAAWEEIFRMAHSIKGGARVCDLGTVEKLAHYLEHLFAGLMRGETDPKPEHREAIREVLNAVEDYMAAIAEKRTPVEPIELLAKIGVMNRQQKQAKSSPTAPLPQPPRETAPPPTVETPAAPSVPGRPAPAVTATEMIRVNATNLDRLLQSSGALLTEGIRQNSLERDLRELAASVEVLQRRCDEALSSADLIRSNVDSPYGLVLDEFRRGLNDIGRRLRRARTLQQEGARAMRAYGEQLQNNVRHARMVPASSVFEGFSKMVRDVARAEGKDVEFISSGLEIDADRLVLQALRNPVMHALRNAVSHGMELPNERAASGKSPQGRVRLEIVVSGSLMLVRVIDDGRGLDLSKIRRRAVERGLVSEESARDLTEDETYELLFRPGFSTASEVTNVSGRGMGLSVVKEAAVRLQGSVRIAPEKTAGTVLTISTPLSIATHRMLLVRAAGQVFAIPSTSVAEVRRVPLSKIRSAEGKSVFMVRGNPVLLATLGDVLKLGSSAMPSERGHIQLALLRVGKRSIALAVEEFVRELAVLTKPLPYPASASPYFSGGVVLEDGNVVLALNVSTVVEEFKGAQLEERIETVPSRATPRKTSVLVVDDSFTARTLQKSILEAAGYDVRIAVDGEQALSLLRANAPDAVVTDVQMPRMDGFQLVEEMKRDERLKTVPVILVTSLNSEEDQARGLALGADAYIVKQKFDHSDLLNVIRQLV